MKNRLGEYMTEEKSKVEIRMEFDKNAIEWGQRVGITDPAIVKVLYWCVLNIYNLSSKGYMSKDMKDDEILNIGEEKK
jgi:hypothetical protein